MGQLGREKEMQQCCILKSPRVASSQASPEHPCISLWWCLRGSWKQSSLFLTWKSLESLLSGCMWDHINHIYNWITRLSPFLFPLGYHKTSIQCDLLKEDKYYTKYEPPLQGSTMSEEYKLEKQSPAESGVYMRWARSHRSLGGKDCQGVRGWEKEEPQNIYSNGPNKERYLWWFIL